MAPAGPPWRRLAERPVYDNPWITVREFDAEAPTGARTIYGHVHFKNQAIGVLPVFEDGTIMLVGQHRFPLGDYSWEIPEGGAPLGGDPLDGARRELKEETGLEADVWRQVMSYQLSNSVTDERGFGFIATGLRQAEAQPDATESLALQRISFAEALRCAISGDIHDLITVAMLFRAHHMAITGELPAGLADAMLAKTGNGS
jgi:8-oxo-dGTP pyrophosphatase MutT (NUDIX family)